MADRLFVDASALVALLAKEPDWEDFAARIKSARESFTSPVAVLEAVMVLTSASGRAPRDVESRVRTLLAVQGTDIVSIGTVTTTEAVGAFERYGKGRHPARLNLGDCFSYACAREHRLALLYKGDDFAQTDLA